MKRSRGEEERRRDLEGGKGSLRRKEEELRRWEERGEEEQKGGEEQREGRDGGRNHVGTCVRPFSCEKNARTGISRGRAAKGLQKTKHGMAPG